MIDQRMMRDTFLCCGNYLFMNHCQRFPFFDGRQNKILMADNKNLAAAITHSCHRFLAIDQLKSAQYAASVRRHKPPADAGRAQTITNGGNSGNF